MLITILSFLPVFALTGREGKLFHPLAFTKTFALVGVALLSITLVPALIPIFLRGRIRSENENWLVRTMIEIFKPMLSWLMDRPGLVIWLFTVIVGLGYVASTKVGREFMPALNEGSILEMPTSVPRTSVTEAADDLRARDAILRRFPEVWQVVGKAGRAETATDPSPLDMVETIINLRDHELWPKRKLEFNDALAQTETVLKEMEAKGILRPVPPEVRRGLVNDAAMAVETRVDATLRDLAMLRLTEFRPELGRALVGDAVDDLLRRLDRQAVSRPLEPRERSGLIEALAASHGDHLALEPLYDDVAALGRDAASRLVALGVLRDRTDLLTPSPDALEQVRETVGEILGARTPDLFTRVTDRLDRGAPHTTQGADPPHQLGALRPSRRSRDLFGHRGAEPAGTHQETDRARGDLRGASEHSGLSRETLRRSADALAEIQGRPGCRDGHGDPDARLG